MNIVSKKTLPLLLVLTLALLSLATIPAYAAGRATFNTGSAVRSAWIELAGGRDNVTAIRQYTGSSLPEGVTTKVVSSTGSETPIYSWFEDGTIYYWSEDTHPYTNADASYMFNGFTKATFIDTAPFDTSKTTDMEAMFANCSNAETIDVSGFDTSNVRCMYCMFYGCSSVKELDVSHFNTTKTTAASDGSYGSLCGMFLGCSSVTELNLSSFDMTKTSWPYHTQNMFPGCTSLEKLILGPKNWFNGYTALSGSWTHEGDGLTLSGDALCRQYNASNALAYSGTWIRNMPEGHYYRTDGSLGETNLWEVHTPSDRFKGYCLNLNKFGVGEELDRVLAEDDASIIELLCTAEEGSTHGSAPLGSSMREALITLIYYGWPNDAAGIQARYGLSDQEYLDITQNAIWDFTDRYDSPAGPSHYTGNQLAAYNELVAQRFANIEGEYILFLYKSWDPSKQNLLSIMGVDDQAYGGVEVKKQNANGSENLAGAEFTVYDEEGNAVGTMVTNANGSAFICRTDHEAGLPLGVYTVRETKPPAGYELSDVVYHFSITEANQIVTTGWRYKDAEEDEKVEEEMIFFDDHDDEYQGGGVGIIKQSTTGKKLVGAQFTIYDEAGNVVKTLETNNAGIAATGKQDLPLGTYRVVETKAPEGYEISGGEQTVTIAEDFQFLTLTFEDTTKRGSIVLEARKVLEADEQQGQQLEAGMFTFQLLDAHNQVIQTATNDAEGTVRFDTIEYTADDLGYANYHIVEVIGDDVTVRYDRHQEDVTVTIYDAGESELSCSAVYDADGAVFTNAYGAKKYDVKILKKKLGTDEDVEAAVLEIRDAGKRLIGSWTSSGEAHTVTLDAGTYTLRETTAPQGYFACSDITFEVGEDGSLSSDSSEVSVDDLTLTVYDRPISSTELELRKIDAETGQVLDGATFALKASEGSYSSVATTDEAGAARFEGLETGTYTLTETDPPAGYRSEGGPWTVDVVYNRLILKSSNVSGTGSAKGTYPSGETTETITVPGSPESIHVELKYQTEDDFDYLELLDASGTVITQDLAGNALGDTREAYRGHFWGGMESGAITTLSFDLPGDSVTFHFVADENTAAYGYYAVVTTEASVVVTNAAGEVVEPEDGVYTIENQKEGASTSVVLGGTKRLEGRELRAGEFTFELTGPDGAQATATNAADGSYAFPELTFTAEGTYAYQVRELAGSAEGITYDDTVYAVAVTVTQSEDGTLTAAISGDSETGSDLDFTNIFKEESKEEEEDSEEEEKDEQKKGSSKKGTSKRGLPRSGDDAPSSSTLLVLASAGVLLVAAAVLVRRRQSGAADA